MRGSAGGFSPRGAIHQIWSAPSGVTATGWQTWTIPRGIGMVWIFAASGGGGGGGGATSAAATAADGGGGGGSGSSAQAVIPARYLPRTLWLLVGAGGAGGAAANAGGNGVVSYLSDQPLTTAANLVFASGAAAGLGGGLGTSSSASAGGTGGTIVSSFPVHQSLGVWYNTLGGENGGAGGAGAAGTSRAWGASSIAFSCGAGGGAANSSTTAFVGGDVTGTTLVNTVKGGAIGASGNPGFGINAKMPLGPFYGDYPWQSFAFTGGSGGGGQVSGAAGAGGQGAWASGGGGGGGGGGTSGGTGGAGGVGGPGFIYIVCW